MHGSAIESHGSLATLPEQPSVARISVGVPEMARLCGISTRYAWWLVHSEQIASFPLGTRRLVDYDVAKAWFKGVAAGEIIPRKYGRLTDAESA
jgi:hypothetical protein